MIILTDRSGFSWLEKAVYATADHTEKVLARWMLTFSPPEFLVSGHGSLFMKEVINRFPDVYRVKHHTTSLYCPETKGTVDSQKRDVLAALRGLLPEFKLGPQGWSCVIPIVQSALNEAPSPRLDRSTHRNIRTQIESITVISWVHLLEILLQIAHFQALRWNSFVLLQNQLFIGCFTRIHGHYT